MLEGTVRTCVGDEERNSSHSSARVPAFGSAPSPLLRVKRSGCGRRSRYRIHPVMIPACRQCTCSPPPSSSDVDMSLIVSYMSHSCHDRIASRTPPRPGCAVVSGQLRRLVRVVACRDGVSLTPVGGVADERVGKLEIR